jgi:hypothetical protein
LGLGAVDLIVVMFLLFVLWAAALSEFPRLDRKAAPQAPRPTPATVTD